MCSSDLTALGVSVGRGLVHYVLLTDDETGRSIVDSRVIAVDGRDGLDDVGRVNAGIDVMLNAAADEDLSVQAIGVATLTGGPRHAVAGKGSGTRRQIRLFTGEQAVAEYLGDTGEIDRYSAVLVVDCGDSGMSMYTLDPATRRTGEVQRSRAISGREIDEALARSVMRSEPGIASDPAFGQNRRDLVSACRTAKEELTRPEQVAQGQVTPAAGVSKVALTAEMVAEAVEPMVAEAREAVRKALALAAGRGTDPEAVVLVGGLVNIPAVRGVGTGHGARGTVIPNMPELASAIGAARLASGGPDAARQTMIGGGVTRGLLSPMPLAAVAAILGAGLKNPDPVGTAPSTVAKTPPAPTTELLPSAWDTTATGATTRLFQNLSESPTQRPTHTLPTDPSWGAATPGWATIELPQPDVTSTTTLLPEPPGFAGDGPTTTLVPPPSTSPTPSTSTTTRTTPTSSGVGTSTSTDPPSSSDSSSSSSPTSTAASSEPSGDGEPAVTDPNPEISAPTSSRTPAPGEPAPESGTEVPEAAYGS